MQSTAEPPSKRGKPATSNRGDGQSKQSARAIQQDNHDNTAQRFNKFGWLRRIYADPTLGGGEKAVLAYVAVFNVMHGGDTFRIRQDTLAKHCGLSESTVGRALRQGKRLGYLSVSCARKPGWGQHGADELRLTLPESPVNLAANSEKSPVNLTTDSAESPVKSEKVTRQSDSYIKEYGSLHGSLREGGLASTAKPASESHRPPPLCPKHPDGPDHDEPCRICKRWREWQEQEPARTAESRRQACRARNAVRDACSLCDEGGWLRGDDGGATNTQCTHEGDGRRTA